MIIMHWPVPNMVRWLTAMPAVALVAITTASEAATLRISPQTRSRNIVWIRLGRRDFVDRVSFWEQSDGASHWKYLSGPVCWHSKHWRSQWTLQPSTANSLQRIQHAGQRTSSTEDNVIVSYAFQLVYKARAIRVNFDTGDNNITNLIKSPSFEIWRVYEITAGIRVYTSSVQLLKALLFGLRLQKRYISIYIQYNTTTDGTEPPLVRLYQFWQLIYHYK